MELVRSSAREKVIFLVALAFAAWAVVKLCLGIPHFMPPQTPTVQGIVPTPPPTDVAERIAVPNYSIYAKDPRNPFAPYEGYKSYLLATTVINATISKSDLRMDVEILYRILREPASTLKVDLPPEMNASGFPPEGNATIQERGRQRVAVLTFKQPIKGNYRLRFSLQAPVSIPGKVEIPPVRPMEMEAETGYISLTLRGGLAHRLRERGLINIKAADWPPVTRPPAGAMYFRKYEAYDKHPYSLAVDVSQGPGVEGTRPPGPTPSPVLTKLQVDIYGVGEDRWAVIRDQTGRIAPKVYRVGDVIVIDVPPSQLKIIRITPSSLFVEEEDGSGRELKELLREKFGY